MKCQTPDRLLLASESHFVVLVNDSLQLADKKFVNIYVQFLYLIKNKQENNAKISKNSQLLNNQ